MPATKNKQRKLRRQKRVRAKISGTDKKPRLCVFRSNKHIYVQLIDDIKKKTILSASDQKLKKGKMTKVDLAKEIGKLIAQKASEKKIEKVIFDRGPYKYHGRVKAVAEGAREGGLKF
ncbi:MAG: 50S ribosomal protein L18 [Parcubacteria group bacterium GW2011_GWF2_43_11]|nr:MAG: 50S ribosomal protein L18 [Parcubacteria group bacterium GW2011_GWF2_43_11]